MPAVVTDAEVERRRRLGIDKRDERWEGEWHLVNPPKNWHVRLAMELIFALRASAEARGLSLTMEHGLFAADDDWRVPDVMVARPDVTYGEAGLAAASAVIEIRSPGDDSYKKLPFYAGRRVREAWIVHRDRRIEIYRLGPDGELVPAAPAADGSVRSEVLGVVLTTVDGPRLRITGDGEPVEV